MMGLVRYLWHKVRGHKTYRGNRRYVCNEFHCDTEW